MSYDSLQARLDTLGEKYKKLIESGGNSVLEIEDEGELLSFLKNSDEIIRAGAVDLLGYSNRENVKAVLMTKIRTDASRIVRAYCCSALCDIAYERNENEGVISFLKQTFKRERSIFTKLAWISDLSKYADSKELEDYRKLIDKGLACRSRHIRYLAVRAILSDFRFLQLFDKEYLNDKLTKEKCRYIQIELQKALEYPQKINIIDCQGDDSLDRPV